MPRKSRVVDRGAIGSGGDVRDRFRNAYKPGAHKAPEPGLMNPLVGIKKIGEVVKSKFKKRSPTHVGGD